jgi:hypothetical protein
MIKGNFILAGWLLVLILCFKPFDAISQISIDIEAGAVYTGYNDVRIPGDEGSFISFSDELNGKTSLFSRVRLGYMFGDRNEVLLLYAPLDLSYKGTLSRDVDFQGETFAAGSKLNATYKFNSYRITYRYLVLKKKQFDLGVGLTLKVRDANIGISNDLGKSSEKTDLGVVPLISFIAHWQPTEQFGLVLDGDALAAPQGRAEDVLLAVTYKATSRLTFRAGYRILEGGADNATVYTFSLFHYAVAGLTVKL